MKVRTEKLFNKLLFSQYPITIKKLADENNVSIRTIRNDISEINSYLSENSLKLIETIRNKGLFLDVTRTDIEKITNSLSLQKDNIYLDKDIRQFNLILEISLGTKFYVYEKEKEFDVSKSTLDSDMRDLRVLLDSYSLELISDAKYGIKLIGSERTIRTMIFEQIFENLGTMSVLDSTKHHFPEFQVLFNFIPLKVIYRIKALYNQFLSGPKDYIYLEQSIIFLNIWINRNHNGNKLRNKDEKIEKPPKDQLIVFIQHVISEFNIAPNDVEVQYIYFMLNTLLNKDQYNSTDWLNAQVFTISLINYVEQKLDISFDRESEIFYERLLEHNLSLFPRIKNNMQIYNPLTESIRQNYPEIFKMVQIFTAENLLLNDNKIKDDEIAFLATHFLTAVSREKQSELSVYRAAVFCNYGLATGNLLAENLKQFFPIDVIAVLSVNELYLLDKLDVDIVFSTSPIETQNFPSLVIDPIMNNKNRRNISRFLEENIKYKQTFLINQQSAINNVFKDIVEILENIYGKINSKSIEQIIEVFDINGLKINTKEIQPMIENILSDEDILLNLKVNNWEEAITEVASPLLDRNIIEDRYVDAMVNSVKEHGPYIVIGDHLALAHARPEDGVNELGLSVATLEPPINFGNTETDPVKIIFCLAAIDSYSHLNIIKSLINLLNDNSNLTDIKNSTSKTDFKNKLFKH